MTAQLSLPIIDISGKDELSIAKQLVDAAATHGFVYIKSLGKDIPIADIDSIFDLSKKFFASPLEDKQACAITPNNKGWSGMHTETLDKKNQRIGDFKECFNIGEFSPENKASQPLPPSLVPDEPELSAFFTTCHNLCLKLLTLFGHGLSIDAAHGGSSWFASRHNPSLGPSGRILRLLYYPSIPASADYQPEVDIRAGAHSDYGSITLLFQRPGQPGLQILTTSGSWAPVAVTPPGTENDPSPPILVNIGDLLSYWTNGLLKSTVHRVIFPKDAKRGGEDRYSVAFFCHPANRTVLEPVPSEMVKERAVDNERNKDGEVKVLTAEEHLFMRLKATYLDLAWDGKEKV